MPANLSAALQITVVGISFVLAALAVLALLMDVLVRLTAEQPAPAAASEPAAGAIQPPVPNRRREAAAVAVAVALARQAHGRPAARLTPPSSPWQAAMRAQLLKQRERRR